MKKKISRGGTKRLNMLADDRQIKVLGLNEIVGQMTRHRWLFRLWQFSCNRNITQPPTHQHNHLFASWFSEKPLNRFRPLSALSFSVAKLLQAEHM